MIARFDHAVIGVADLDRAMSAYRKLGFEVRPGGRHTGEGTHNAIVRFGVDYLELMAIRDEAEARSQPFGSQLYDFLRGREGGHIGYVVGGRDLPALAERLAASGARSSGPLEMQRERLDGHVLKWRLLFPNGRVWRDVAPFVIEWITPDADRLAWDAPVPQPNGVTGVAALSILVADLRRASALYAETLGLSVVAGAGGRVNGLLGHVGIELVARDADAAAAGLFATDREGVVDLTLRVRTIAHAQELIPGLAPVGDGRFRIPPEDACGARLLLEPISPSR